MVNLLKLFHGYLREKGSACAAGQQNPRLNIRLVDERDGFCKDFARDSKDECGTDYKQSISSELHSRLRRRRMRPRHGSSLRTYLHYSIQTLLLATGL